MSADEREHGPLPFGESADGESDSDELRQIYRRLQPPALPDHAAEADPETARVVQWMQGAWRGLALPPARVPLAPRLSTRPIRHLRFALVAAAAVLLLVSGTLVTGTALWRALTRSSESTPEPRMAQGPPPASATGVEILAVRPDQVELRSGPVRLVLLGPPPTDSEQDSGI